MHLKYLAPIRGFIHDFDVFLGQISTPPTNLPQNSWAAAQTHHKPASVDLNDAVSPSPPGQITIIDTPRAYEAFKRHEYAVNAQIVHIEAGAHANLLTEVKHFWNAAIGHPCVRHAGHNSKAIFRHFGQVEANRVCGQGQRVVAVKGEIYSAASRSQPV